MNRRIHRTEATLSVLEAKLSSIPGLDAVTLPALPSQNSLTLTEPNLESDPISETPRSDLQQTPEVNNLDSSISMTEVDRISPDEVVRAKDHPAYAKFFRMIHLGVPLLAVANKCRAENPSLDVELLKTPDELIPTHAPGERHSKDQEEEEEVGWSQ